MMNSSEKAACFLTRIHHCNTSAAVKHEKYRQMAMQPLSPWAEITCKERLPVVDIALTKNLENHSCDLEK